MFKFYASTMLCVLTFFPASESKGQGPFSDAGNNPVFFLDSSRINADEMFQLNPRSVGVVTVLPGNDGKDSVVYVETINFIKRRYWDYFRSKENFLNLVKKVAGYQETQFVLNDEPLSDLEIGKLAGVNDETLVEFQIVSEGELRRKYKVKNKKCGIVVKAQLQ